MMIYIRRIIKLAALWTIAWIVGGALIGIITGFGDTGHLGLISLLIIFVTGGAIFGVLGGLSFAPFYTCLAPHLKARSLRIIVATILGTMSGLLGLYASERILSSAHEFVFDGYTVGGAAAGAITGLVCQVFSPADCVHST